MEAFSPSSTSERLHRGGQRLALFGGCYIIHFFLYKNVKNSALTILLGSSVSVSDPDTGQRIWIRILNPPGQNRIRDGKNDTQK
jgi:hypothetical protein